MSAEALVEGGAFAVSPNGLVSITFNRSYGKWMKGDVAGFPEATARSLTERSHPQHTPPARLTSPTELKDLIQARQDHLDAEHLKLLARVENNERGLRAELAQMQETLGILTAAIQLVAPDLLKQIEAKTKGKTK